MDGETHIGIGVLDGKLILGLTLAGYNDTQKNVSHLVVLARIEDAVARAVVGFHGFFDQAGHPGPTQFCNSLTQGRCA